MKLYYCPYCGKNRFFYCGEDVQSEFQCKGCGVLTRLIESKHESTYYNNRSEELYGWNLYSTNVLIDEEVSKNPLFDPKKSAKKPIMQSVPDSTYKNMQHVYSDNAPKCPTCQSTNIKKISSMKRSLHAVAFGVFNRTAQSQFECENCGYKW